jgi:hypothetical protein
VNFMERLRPERMRLGRTAEAVAYGRVAELRGPVRRTLATRVAVAVALVALLAGALLAALDTSSSRSEIVPKGTSGVVVVDLSKSIIESEFETIGSTFRRLISTNTPSGLVVFSDVAYELLPPHAPASALVPLLRFFTPVRGHYPTNPWQATFRAGTRISVALELAHEMLTRDEISDGSIILVSDLETASSDSASLSETLGELKREKVPVRIVPLRPTDHARKLFTSLLGPSSFLPAPHSVAGEGTTVHDTLQGRLPLALLLLGGLLLAALGLNERLCARLALPAPVGERP